MRSHSRSRSLATYAVPSVIFSVLVSACTLALDSPKTLSTDCQFKGNDSACGQCIKSNCAALLGACCGNANCQDTLGDLDDCAGSDDQLSCGKLRESGALGACVNASCKQLCLGSGDGSCFTSDAFCTCNDLAPSDTSKCSEASLGVGSCCADFGWPGTGLSCNCQAFRCKETASGCECSSEGDGPSTSCTGVHCCLTSFDCECSNKPCVTDEDEVAVPACTSDLVKCSSGARVGSCSESVR